MIYYARLQDHIAVEIVIIPNGFTLKSMYEPSFIARCVLCDESTRQGYVYDPATGAFSPPVPPAPSPEEQQAAFTNAIQQRLDDFARTRNYDNALSCASYATSTNSKFAAEGQYIVEARDATWAVGYQILDDVMSGKRPMPTWEEVEAELPALAWPEV